MTLSRRLNRARAWARINIIATVNPLGRAFDVLIILLIVIGILALILESVPAISQTYAESLVAIEYTIGTIFLLEYLLRVWVATHRWKYMTSLWGVVDLLAIFPFFLRGTGLAYLRLLRVLRIFSVLKVARYSSAANILLESLRESRSKIGVFLLTVVIMVLMMGFVMHAVEPETFSTIPEAIWWAIVTISTVGYGDYVPQTVFGKMLGSLLMVTAFGIIAVPSGIVAGEYSIVRQRRGGNPPCENCRRVTHDANAAFCAHCGTRLRPAQQAEGGPGAKGKKPEEGFRAP